MDLPETFRSTKIIRRESPKIKMELSEREYKDNRRRWPEIAPLPNLIHPSRHREPQLHQ